MQRFPLNSVLIRFDFLRWIFWVYACTSIFQVLAIFLSLIFSIRITKKLIIWVKIDIILFIQDFWNLFWSIFEAIFGPRVYFFQKCRFCDFFGLYKVFGSIFFHYAISFDFGPIFWKIKCRFERLFVLNGPFLPYTLVVPTLKFCLEGQKFIFLLHFSNFIWRLVLMGNKFKTVTHRAQNLRIFKFALKFNYGLFFLFLPVRGLKFFLYSFSMSSV